MAYSLVTFGAVTVTTAGTRVRITASDIPVASVYIEALDGNSGKMYVGDLTVSSTKYTSSLTAGNGVTVQGPNVRGIEEEFYLSDFYIDASVNGEKVLVSYLKRR